MRTAWLLLGATVLVASACETVGTMYTWRIDGLVGGMLLIVLLGLTFIAVTMGRKSVALLIEAWLPDITTDKKFRLSLCGLFGFVLGILLMIFAIRRVTT